MTVSSVGHNAFELHEQPVSYQPPAREARPGITSLNLICLCPCKQPLTWQYFLFHEWVGTVMGTYLQYFQESKWTYTSGFTDSCNKIVKKSYSDNIVSTRYHHMTKLQQKILTGGVSFCIICYECTARVTVPNATNGWVFFFGIAWYYGSNNFIIQTHCIFRLACMACSTWYRFLHDLQQIYKLCVPARLPQ